MPKGVVKTAKQETYWERAKRQVAKQYPNISVGSDRYYRLVMSIYKNMAHYKPKGRKNNKKKKKTMRYGAKRGMGRGRGVKGGGRRNRNRSGCARGGKGYGRGGGRGRGRYRLG